jgi:YegS/Rv2252/BmrU family lipid kinase
MSNIIKVGFIINPLSGKRSKNAVPGLIKNYLDTKRYMPVIEYTQKPGHATQLTQEMVKNDIPFVIAVGGDGTVNEVGKGLIHTDSALGIIPFGSGNGLARHLQIPLDTKEAIEMINNHKIAEIDYGLANDIPFFCTCGVGFDAHIGQQFAQCEKRGFATYFKSTVGEFIKYKAKKYTLKNGSIKIKKRAFLVTFANASQYGNNAYIAPDADIQDGLIDVCILEPFPFYRIIGLGYKLFSKQIDKSQYVDILKAKEIKLKRKKRDVFHFDGEPCIMKKKIKIKVQSRGLKVIVPANSKLQTL